MPDAADTSKFQTRARSLVLAIGSVIAIVLWIATMLKPRGDFSNHWEFGRRFVAGEFLYTGGLNTPYPPFFAAAYAPLSMLPLRVAKPVMFVGGLAALLAVLWVLDALTRHSLPLSRERHFWLVAATLLVTSRFVLRDFADAGQNLILFALTWGGIYGWSRGRTLLAGASLGLATALKCTPALFILYFAWKRQWKMAGAAVLFAGLFTLSPALVQTSYVTHMQTWLGTVVRGVSQPDPSIGVLGPEELQNKSLRPVLARYLMHLPEGHPARGQGNGYLDFLDLVPQTAGLVIKMLMLALFAAVAWGFRRPLTGRDDPAMVWECATVSLLTLLYSPITWGQHCVATIPAIYLLGRNIATGHRLPPWTQWTLGLTSLVLIVANRSLIGRNLSLVLESYHLVTLCVLALLVMMLGQHRHHVTQA